MVSTVVMQGRGRGIVLHPTRIAVSAGYFYSSTMKQNFSSRFYLWNSVPDDLFQLTPCPCTTLVDAICTSSSFVAMQRHSPISTNSGESRVAADPLLMSPRRPALA